MKENLFYIEQIKSSLHAAIIGSCNCNVKSPEPAYHLAYCRYVKILSCLEYIDDLENNLKNSLDSIK